MELQDNALTAAAKSRGLAASRWWRWTRYELRAGYIRPKPGAKLRTYDPWKLWRATRPAARRSDSGAQGATPYRALLEMLRKLKYRGDTDDSPRFPPLLASSLPLTTTSEQAVLDFCTDYGLLGILPHRALQVILSPRGNSQVQYIRIGGGWLALERDQRNPNTPMLHPTAVVQPLLGSVIAIEPLSTTWARFFPDVPKPHQVTFAYPQPLTPEFWEAYCEPLEDFLSGARALQLLLDGILMQRNSQLRLLHALVTSGGIPLAAHPLVAPMGLGVRASRSGQIKLSWVGNSLLASLATMLLEDLSVGKALQCPCGQLFVSSAYQARYCSTPCRWRFEQRRFRSSGGSRQSGKSTRGEM